MDIVWGFEFFLRKILKDAYGLLDCYHRCLVEQGYLEELLGFEVEHPSDVGEMPCFDLVFRTRVHRHHLGQLIPNAGHFPTEFQLNLLFLREFVLLLILFLFYFSYLYSDFLFLQFVDDILWEKVKRKWVV